MRGLIAAALLLLSGASHAQIITINENLATSSNTFYFDTNTPRLTLGSTFYSGSVASVVLNTSSNAVVGSSVLYATGTIDSLSEQLVYGIQSSTGVFTSTLTVQGNAFSVGGSSFVVTAGSVTIPYLLVVGSITMSSSSSTITTASSITASAFFGDGSHLSGISAGSTVGISSAGIVGYALTNSTITNGLVTGGIYSPILILNSTQTVSGQTAFTSTVTFSGPVSNSSTTVNLQGRTNNGQTSFITAVATVTLTVSGLNLVEVCYAGNLTTTGASNHAAWSFEVNGSFLANSGLSSSGAAVASQYVPSTSESANLSACFPIPPGMLAKGTYNFQFVPMCNSTCTMGGSGTTSTAYFTVKEDH